jgi:hypothetical protein
LHKPTNNFCNSDLVPREALDGKHASIFDRHGYRAENGEPVKMTSHQARHLLNTIAQRGGLSNLEIAKWSGRADVKQNRTYNHMTEYELVGMAERLDHKSAIWACRRGGKAFARDYAGIQYIRAFAVHVTEYGYRVHDYTMSPCEKFRDCVNCTEQVCIKGDDTEKLDRIKKTAGEVGTIVFACRNVAVASGEMGADRWYQYHKKTVTRLRELVAILKVLILKMVRRLSFGHDFSQLRRIAEKKSIESIEKGKVEEAVM